MPQHQIQLPFPYEGLDLSKPLHALEPTFTNHLMNYLVHEEGRLLMRGPIIFKATNSPRDSAGNTSNGWSRAYNVGGLPIPGSTTRMFMPILHPTASTDDRFPDKVFEWVQGGGDVQTGQPTTWNSDGTFATNHTIATFPYEGGLYFSERWCTHASWTVSISTRRYLAETITHNGIPHPRTKLSVIKTGASIQTVPYSAPMGCADVAAYARRLWAAGGSFNFAAGNLAEGQMLPNTLWYTEIDADITAIVNGDVANNWKANNLTANPFNKITVGTERPDDWIVRIIPLDKSMLIIKRRSVWLLVGSGPENFAVRQIDDTRGCIDPRSALESRGVAYWLSDEGLCHWDGAEVAVLSHRVNSHMKVASREGHGASYPPLYYMHEMPNDYLWMYTVTNVDFASGSKNQLDIDEDSALLYHIPTKRWSHMVERLDHDGDRSYWAAGQANITTIWKPGSHWYGMGGSGTNWELTFTTDPEAMTEDDWTTYPLGLDHSASSLYVEIPAEVRLPPVRLAWPSNKAALRRILFEYLMLVDSNPSLAPRFLVQILRYGQTLNPDDWFNYTETTQVTGRSYLDMYAKSLAYQWLLQGREVNDFYLDISRINLGSGTGLASPSFYNFVEPQWWGSYITESDQPSQRPSY